MLYAYHDPPLNRGVVCRHHPGGRALTQDLFYLRQMVQVMACNLPCKVRDGHPPAFGIDAVPLPFFGPEMFADFMAATVRSSITACLMYDSRVTATLLGRRIA